MRYGFEEEFRLENPQWDFDNDITAPYIRWIESKLAEARKQLALYNVAERSEQLPLNDYCVNVSDDSCPHFGICLNCS